MKKFNFKSFILGVLVTVLILGMTIPGLAEATTKTAELYYNSIKVRLNGKILELKDAQGNDVEPFIMNGTNYLPVRALAEALGLPVSWDAATQTVILGQDQEHKQPAAWLGDLNTFTGKHVYEINHYGVYESNSRHVANNGSTYERILYPESNEVSYLLNGQYSKFTGTIYLRESHKNAINGCEFGMTIYLIYLDDQLVYTSDSIKSGSLPCDFSIDVTNAYQMKIVPQFSRNKEPGNFTSNYYGTYATPIGYPALWQ